MTLAPSRPGHDEDWWLISNRYGGIHRAPGATAAEAKAAVRAAIAESFQIKGLSATDARRAAVSYRVRVLAGPACYEQVVEAFEAWDSWDPGDADLGPAAALARRTGHHRIARALVGGGEREARER